MDNTRKPTKRQQWFIDRIGKRVFRNKTSCDCATCTNVWIHGLIIDDEMHADYLCSCEAEYTIEGSPMEYFDTKEEAVKFESELVLKQ